MKNEKADKALKQEDKLADSAAGLRSVPLYKYSFEYANEHNESGQYLISSKLNISCRLAIEAAIRDNDDKGSLGADAIKDVLERFGPERISYILANTIRQSEGDDRYYSGNRVWAHTTALDGPLNKTREFLVHGDPSLINLFTDLARKEMDAAKEHPERGKSSVVQKPIPSQAGTSRMWRRGAARAGMNKETKPSLRESLKSAEKEAASISRPASAAQRKTEAR